MADRYTYYIWMLAYEYFLLYFVLTDYSVRFILFLVIYLLNVLTCSTPVHLHFPLKGAYKNDGEDFYKGM